MNTTYQEVELQTGGPSLLAFFLHPYWRWMLVACVSLGIFLVPFVVTLFCGMLFNIQTGWDWDVSVHFWHYWWPIGLFWGILSRQVYLLCGGIEPIATIYVAFALITSAITAVMFVCAAVASIVGAIGLLGWFLHRIFHCLSMRDSV